MAIGMACGLVAGSDGSMTTAFVHGCAWACTRLRDVLAVAITVPVAALCMPGPPGAVR